MPDPIWVLMVEDSEDDAELVRHALRRGDFEVTSRRVDTAVELSAALAAGPWDLVIADYNLPQFDAVAALGQVRERDLDLPFIVVSGAIGEEVAVELMKAGAQDYVFKGNLTRLAAAARRELAEAQGRRKRRAVESEARAYEGRLRLLSAKLALAEQNERRRIATGLHDDICQMLAVAKIKLGFTQMADSPAEQKEGFRELAEILEGAIRETRYLLYELSSPVLSEMGLAKAIEGAAARVREQHGLPIEVVVLGEVPRLAEDREVTIFQASKELLNNVVKHAAATQVSVEIACAPEELRVSVTDNGEGFDSSALALHRDGGFGLLNIRERLAYLGGHLEVDSAPGRGCRMTISTPV